MDREDSVDVNEYAEDCCKYDDPQRCAGNWNLIIWSRFACTHCTGSGAVRPYRICVINMFKWPLFKKSKSECPKVLNRKIRSKGSKKLLYNNNYYYFIKKIYKLLFYKKTSLFEYKRLERSHFTAWSRRFGGNLWTFWL